ncbi:probable G-protein coupled receptor 139 [Heptranchias perlo]|uniref:probable G-protein coupled receptor 139 n=1 Tax=Heptranchias perlo TaxID=212740 RepID=UPI00355A8F95
MEYNVGKCEVIHFVNLLAIVILSRGKCGLSKCITRYLVAMATADLLVIVCNVILYRIAHLYWGDTFLFYTRVCRFILFLAPTATDSSVWLTVAFTFDRFVAISCQKLKTKYCTEKTSLVIIVTLSALFGLKNIPRPFVYVPYPYVTINNIPWGCLVSSQFYILPTWIAFSWIEQLLTPLLPFCLILLFNALTVRRILVASRARRSLRDLSNGENDKDPEMKNRRRSIVLLFAISGSFILLWMTTVVYFLYYRISGVFHRRSLFNPFATFEQAGILLQLLSSCTNTAIYTVTQSKFREELLNVIKYPFTLIGCTPAPAVPPGRGKPQANRQTPRAPSPGPPRRGEIWGSRQLERLPPRAPSNLDLWMATLDRPTRRSSD